MAANANAKFRRLIEGRKVMGASTPASSFEHLKRKFINFLDQNQNLERLIAESAHNFTEKHFSDHHSSAMDNSYSLTVDGCIALLRHQAAQGSCSLDQLAAEVFANQLLSSSRRKISGSCEDECATTRLSADDHKASVMFIAEAIKTLLAEHSFNRVHFAKCLSSKGHQLHLEVLYILHTESIMSFNTYLAYSLQSVKSVKHLVESFIDLCFHLDEERKQQQELILSVLLGVALHLAYPDDRWSKTADKTGLAQMSQDVLSKVIDGCEHRKANGPQSSALKSSQVLEVIRTAASVPHSLVSRFFARQLDRLLSSPAVLPTSHHQAAVAAFSNQKNWTFASLSEDLREYYTQFLLVFETQTIMDALKHALRKQEVAWRMVLSFLSVFLVRVEEAARLVEEYVSYVTSEALSSCDSHLLHVAFLVVRQASQEGGHVFQPYVTWFQKTFGESSSSGLNSKRTVQFFMKFLTDLVPCEPAEYLKVQIIKSPALPSKLRPSLTDYVSLAKTRLVDLKEPLELMPLSGESSGVDGAKSGRDKQLEQAASDVEKALEAYEKSGKVPSSVMEASIFRKPYFVGRFLPALLLPRKIPDVPDARLKFIETLTKAGKIPGSLVKAYKAACEQAEGETSQVISSDDGELGELSMLGKLQKTLMRTTVAVLESREGKAGVTSLLSLVGAHIKAVFTDQNEAGSSRPISELERYDVTVTKTAIQASDVILNAFCRTCAAVRSRRAGASAEQQRSCGWAVGFVALLASIPEVHTGLGVRLRDLISTQGPVLKEHHICGLAAFLCHVGACEVGTWCAAGLSQLSERRPQSKPALGNEEAASWPDFLCDAIPINTGQWMEFALRFYCCFVQYALLNFSDVTVNTHQHSAENSCYVPPTLVKKLVYLIDRLNVVGDWGPRRSPLAPETLRLARAIHSAPAFNTLKRSVRQVTFAEWCSWELGVCCGEDFLTGLERRLYHQYTTLNHYLPLPSPGGGCDGDPRVACSALLESILEFDAGKKCDSGCRQDLINLLHSLLPLLSRRDRAEGDARGQWLVTWLQSRMQQTPKDADGVTSSVTQHRSQVASFMRLASELPPHLLLSDRPDSVPGVATVDSVVSSINTTLKPNLAELCCFPFDVTFYLLKAALSCAGPGGSLGSPAGSPCRLPLSSLLEQCPIFFISLEHYWKQLEPVAVRLCGGPDAQQGYLRRVDSVFTYLNRIHSPQGPTGARQVPLRDLHSTCEPFVLAPCLFLRITSQNDIKFLLAADDCFDRFSLKVLVCLFDCFMAKLASRKLEGCEIVEGDVWFDCALAILKKVPRALLVFSDDDEYHEFKSWLQRLRTEVMEDGLRKMYPVVYFSFLMRIPQAASQQMLSFDWFLQVTLRMHVEFESLRVYGPAPIAHAPVEPFLLDFCLQASTFVRETIASSSAEFLRSLPPGLLSRCQPEVQYLVASRLKR